MNYMREINAFYDRMEVQPLPPSCIALWHGLMAVANKAGWPECFSVAAKVLEGKTSLSRDGVFAARERLGKAGLLQWQSRKGRQAAEYRMVSLCRDSEGAPQSPAVTPEGKKRAETGKNLTDLIVAYTQNPAVLEALEGYLIMRTAKKKPATARALGAVLKELDRLSGGDDNARIAILDQSTRNSWTDVYALKPQPRAGEGADTANPFLRMLLQQEGERS